MPGVNEGRSRKTQEWASSPYNGFAKGLFFGGEGIIADTDPEQQEKIIKDNDLVAKAMIFQNVVDLTMILADLLREGYPVTAAEMAALSP